VKAHDLGKGGFEGAPESAEEHLSAMGVGHKELGYLHAGGFAQPFQRIVHGSFQVARRKRRAQDGERGKVAHELSRRRLGGPKVMNNPTPASSSRIPCAERDSTVG